MAKTISFAKGKGNIRHNNRDFISENIDKTRIKDNIVYVQQPLEEAYQEIFGQAVQEYNNKQKRADRKITDYMEHLKTSKNREKLFYDVVVQVGDKDDSGSKVFISSLTSLYSGILSRFLSTPNSVISIPRF